MASVTAAGKSSQRFPALRLFPRGSHTFLGTKVTTFTFMAGICLPREFLESKVSKKMTEEDRRETGEAGEEEERGRLGGQRVSSNIVLAWRNLIFLRVRSDAFTVQRSLSLTNQSAERQGQRIQREPRSEG